MIVLRKTMDAALQAERDRAGKERQAFYAQYGDALHRSEALQKQLSAWVLNKADNITPEQMATLFYEQDADWQAKFFNSLQGVIQTAFDANPRSFWKSPGYPAGDMQWCYMADAINDSGFETLEAMFGYAKYVRENRSASAIEAATAAETTEIGSVHESAVRDSADAPKVQP